LYSSATGSIASADGEPVVPTARSDLLVGVGGGQQALGHVRLELVVLLDHDDLLACHLHRAAGGVVQAHLEAGDRLLGVGLQRAGLAGDDGDLHFFGLAEGRCCNRSRQNRESHQLTTLHEKSPVVAGHDCACIMPT
jgi:hypothetical protein